jgi:hypothetical protein
MRHRSQDSLFFLSSHAKLAKLCDPAHERWGGHSRGSDASVFASAEARSSLTRQLPGSFSSDAKAASPHSEPAFSSRHWWRFLSRYGGGAVGGCEPWILQNSDGGALRVIAIFVSVAQRSASILMVFCRP